MLQRVVRFPARRRVVGQRGPCRKCGAKQHQGKHRKRGGNGFDFTYQT